jgi:hypothetical protein
MLQHRCHRRLISSSVCTKFERISLFWKSCHRRCHWIHVAAPHHVSTSCPHVPRPGSGAAGARLLQIQLPRGGEVHLLNCELCTEQPSSGRGWRPLTTLSQLFCSREHLTIIGM